MKINSWNVRGINASNKRKSIKRLVDDMKSDIVFLQETNFHKNHMKRHYSNGQSGLPFIHQVLELQEDLQFCGILC